MPSGHSNKMYPFCCRFQGFEPITQKPSNPFAMSCASCWLWDSALRAENTNTENTAKEIQLTFLTALFGQYKVGQIPMKCSQPFSYCCDKTPQLQKWPHVLNTWSHSYNYFSLKKYCIIKLQQYQYQYIWYQKYILSLPIKFQRKKKFGEEREGVMLLAKRCL